MLPQNYIKHKVRSSDNLTSLAERINISESDLKKFHNQNCGKMNKLWVTNLKGIEFVLIPTNFISKEDFERQQHKMLPSENYFSNFHSTKYSVEENIKQFGKEDLKINYNIEINTQEKRGCFVTEISVQDHQKNGDIPDDKISSLSLDCMNSIYPISFQISENGLLESCYEHQNTVEKHTLKRQDLEDFYIGEISKNYLDKFEQNISDGDYFLTQIQSQFLYQILFPNLQWFHKKAVWKERFTIYPNSFPLDFQFKTENKFENDNYIETILSGNLSENCSLRELLTGTRIEDENWENFVQVGIKTIFHTNKISKGLTHIKSYADIWFQEELFQKHTLYITQNNDENVLNKSQ